VQTNIKNNKGDLALSFSLGCDNKSKSTNWLVRGVAEFRLVHHSDPKNNLIKRTEHLFRLGSNAKGCSSFITMKEILDQEKGLFFRSSS
jgi:hypothetical protein